MALKESDSGLHRLGQIQMAQLDIQIWSDSSGLDKNGIEYFQTRVVLTLGSMVFWLSGLGVPQCKRLVPQTFLVSRRKTYSPHSLSSDLHRTLMNGTSRSPSNTEAWPWCSEGPTR